MLLTTIVSRNSVVDRDSVVVLNSLVVEKIVRLVYIVGSSDTDSRTVCSCTDRFDIEKTDIFVAILYKTIFSAAKTATIACETAFFIVSSILISNLFSIGFCSISEKTSIDNIIFFDNITAVVSF